jgi:hypothetical protein
MPSFIFPLAPSVRAVSFFFLALGYLYLTASSHLGGFGGDNATYLLSADFLSPFTPHNAVAKSYFQGSIYPPLYPLALALSGSAHNLLVAHLVTTLFLLAAFVLIYRWQRKLGIFPWLAFGYSAVFALMPGTYLQAFEILSENAYLFFTLLTLLSSIQYETTGKRKWLLTAAIAAGCAMLTRTVGVALVGALVLHILIKQRKRSDWLAIGLAIGPPLLWHTLHSNTVYLSILTGSHTAASAPHVDIGLQLTAIWFGWSGLFGASDSLAITATIAAYGIICLLGLLYRLSLLKLDALYIAAYLGIILLWPFPGEMQRFLFPALPVLMIQGLLLIHGFAEWLMAGKRGAISALILGVLAAVIGPELALNLQRFALPVPTALSDFKRTAGWFAPDPQAALATLYSSAQITHALTAAQTIVPADACITSIKPSVTSYYTQHPSKSPPGSATSNDAFDAWINKDGCHYFLLLSVASPTFPSAFYPLTRMQGRLELLEVTPLTMEPGSPIVAMLARLKGPTAIETKSNVFAKQR